MNQHLVNLFGPEVVAKKALRGMDLSAVSLGWREDMALWEQTSLVGWDLRGANFQGTNLTCVDFTGADLRGANLKGATFGARYPGSEDVTSFCNADLRDACLDGVVGSSKFDGADCRETSFRNASLGFDEASGRSHCSSFSEVDFRRAVLDGASLKYSGFYSANLEGASLRGVNLDWSCFRDVNAMGADFSGARLCNAVIKEDRLPNGGPHLPGIFWLGAKLFGADISGIDRVNDFFLFAEGVVRIRSSRLPWLTWVPVLGAHPSLWVEGIRLEPLQEGI